MAERPARPRPGTGGHRGAGCGGPAAGQRGGPLITLQALVAIGLAAGLAAVATALWWRRTRQLRTAQDELNRRMNELFSLQELTFLLAESLEPNRVVQQVARYLVRFLEADGALVALLEPSGSAARIAAAEGTVSYLAGSALAEDDRGLLRQAMTHGRVEEVEGTRGAAAEIIGGFEVHRAAVAPLKAHGNVLGAVAVVNRPDRFGETRLRLLTTVAAHTATVLSNGRLFELTRSAKREWEGTFDALNDGVVLLDPDGAVRRANRAFADLIGRPVAEVGGVMFLDAVFGRSADVRDLLEAARRGDRVRALTLRSEPLGRVLRVGAAGLRSPGVAGWVVAFVEDVTEQKALEAQVIQQEKMAVVGQLVSGVAHELNNPLTSIAGLSELLTEQPDTPARAREHLRVLHEQAERAGKIVRNLLTFARQGPSEHTVVDVNDVAQRTVMLIAYEVRLRAVDLHTELAPDAPFVVGDRHHLQQVVINLLTNAVQAAASGPSGHPRTVVLRTGAAEGEALLTVEDSGPGIPDGVVPQIFTPFFTTKPPGQGTGLGLSLSYNIAERHGGTIEYRRAPGGGAQFTLRLPAARTPETAAPAPAARAAAPSAPVAAGRSILLVDGDPAVRRTISALLASDGHRVEAARDAAHGIELLERTAFDLVIADPRSDLPAGRYFADVLLARWPQARGRTIFTTADVRPETDDWLRRLGCRYFRKPFNAPDLRAAAVELLSAG